MMMTAKCLEFLTPIEPDADTFDQSIGAEVTLPNGEKILSAKVALA